MSNFSFKNMNANPNDEYYTDKRAIVPLLKHLKNNSIIWCPFDTEKSEYVKVLKKAGHKIIFTHIWNGQDFLNYNPKFGYDYIISNPPYSIKKEILKKLIELDKPFAMLFGVQALTNRGFMKIWRENNIKLQLIIFENKLFFENGIKKPTHYKKAGTYFHTYYFCNGWLKKDLFVEVV